MIENAVSATDENEDAPGDGASAAMLNIGTTITFQWRLHVIVGITPIGVTPCMVELEDLETGRVRSVQAGDPELTVVVPRVDVDAQPDLPDGTECA